MAEMPDNSSHWRESIAKSQARRTRALQLCLSIDICSAPRARSRETYAQLFCCFFREDYRQLVEYCARTSSFFHFAFLKPSIIHHFFQAI